MSILRIEGNTNAKLTAMPIVISPPPAIAHGTPNILAATPLSNAPSSFDAPMKTPSTALTRPSCSSGVTSGTIDPRMNIDTMSAAEITISATNATA